MRSIFLGLLLLACGPKQAPAAASAPQAPLQGSWFLLDTEVGPPSGRLELLDEGRATVINPSGASTGFSYSAVDEGVELRGDAGGVLLAVRAGEQALLVYGATGRASTGYRIEPFDGQDLGEWVFRDPGLPAGRRLRLSAGADGVANLTVSGRTFLCWQIVRPSGPAWVVLPRDAASGSLGRVWQLHQGDGGYLVSGRTRGKIRILHRPGAGPAWLGVDTGEVPDAPDPWLP